MPYCISCGESISETQKVKFRGLCPHCIRLEKTSVPLKSLAKSQADEWLGLVFLGGLFIVGSIVLLLMGLFLKIPIAFMAPIVFGIGLVMIIFGYSNYKKALQELK